MAMFATEPQFVREQIAPGSGTYTATATHAATTITLPAQGAGLVNSVGAAVISYTGGTPAGGGLTITDGGTTIFQMDYNTAAALVIDLKKLANQYPNQSLVFTLADGGANIVGKISLLGVQVLAQPYLYSPAQMDFSNNANAAYVAVL